MAEVQDLEAEEIGEIEAVVQQEETKQQEPELPEKYRGKSAAEIVKMHQEAEKLIDRQSREVGEVRKLADELLRSQLTKPEPEKPKEVDFFENPQEAIRQAVENNPKVVAAEQTIQQYRQMQAQQALIQRHPDMPQLVQDQGFIEWVTASKVRQKLFQQADAYDLDAADELLSTYKELKQVKQAQTQKVDTAERDKTLKTVAVETGGSGESAKKVYRRADLIRLKMRDPAKYESMMDEIMTAYAEDRVK